MKWTEVPASQNRAYQIGETGKIRWRVLRYLTGSGLDLGCGPDRVTGTAIGIDKGPGNLGRQSQANLTADVTDLRLWADGKMDFVYSSHTLEHIPDWKAALREWWRVLKPGGHLVLYLPHPDLYDDPEGSKDHHSRIAPKDLEDAMYGCPGGWDQLVAEVRDQADEYSFLQVYRKRADRKKVKALETRPEKSVCVIRYGGMGDHLMFSSVTERLKRDGWHVVYVTNPSGAEIVKHDPNLDEIWTDTAGLPDTMLPEYWGWLGTQFRLCIQGMNTLENALLPQPTSPQYGWPESARRALWGRMSYQEFQHLTCGVPLDLPLRSRFYPTPKEEKWAAEERRKIAKEAGSLGPVVLWALSGSAVHKVSPYTPAAVAQVLRDSSAVVVTTGGEKEASLYADFAEDKRHVRRAGAWTARQSLAFAVTQADVVAGPETGILNAVGPLDVPKAVWLSHSSELNLCKHWPATLAVLPDPDIAPCAPCHRLHWGWANCRKAESGAALCVEGIPPGEMSRAVLTQLAARAQAAA